MEIRKRNAMPLYRLFLRYLAILCLSTVAWFLILVLLLGAGISSGFILPANYAEQALNTVEKQLENGAEFEEEILPFFCEYAVFDANKAVLKSNMNEKEIRKVLQLWEDSFAYTNKWYKSIAMKDTVCVISYDMQPHFSSPIVDKVLPGPQNCGILLFFIGFLGIAVLIAWAFGRNLRMELVPIIEATEAIKAQELQLFVRETGVTEFNHVLDSMRDISVALEASLKQQFSLRQYRKNQISAITHDIKTPLTIIKGNTELLQEANLSAEDRELLEYIHVSSDKIENCLDMLMEAAKAEEKGSSGFQKFSISECICELENQARAQCKTKDILLNVENRVSEGYFRGDIKLIIRAVSNILDNAIEYTPKHGCVNFIISMEGEKLVFTVEDSGKGFSAESLKKAKEEFYTEKKERSGKHYGLGLFIADSIAHKHNGELRLGNKPDGSGAVVELHLKYMG